jgi:membrane fusion protein, adhesin transport system
MIPAADIRRELADLQAATREAPPAAAGDPAAHAPRGRGGAVLIWLCFLALAAFLGWASRAELEQVVRGSGRVIPDSLTQVVQSLEPGIIGELHVREGQRVRAGELLLKLLDTELQARYRESLNQRDVLAARLVRLQAEAAGSEPEFPAELAAARPDLVEKEKLLFVARRDDEQAKARQLGGRLGQLREKARLLAPGFAQGVFPPVQKVELEAEIGDLEAQIATQRTAFVRQALESHDQESAKLQSIHESIKADQARLERATFRSPVDGVVNAIFVETVGRVVQAGAPILEIVPEDDSLLIEARIRPADIAFLSAGQAAMVRFTAYDFASYGGLDGEVETLGADTITPPEGEPYYPIKVRTRMASLGIDRRSGTAMALKPGMVAEVDIITGRQTVLDYLLKPIHRARAKALRER